MVCPLSVSRFDIVSIVAGLESVVIVRRVEDPSLVFWDLIRLKLVIVVADDSLVLYVNQVFEYGRKYANCLGTLTSK
jgi:hypothetical protein